MKTPKRTSPAGSPSGEIITQRKEPKHRKLRRSLSQNLWKRGSHGSAAVRNKLQKLGILSEARSFTDINNTRTIHGLGDAQERPVTRSFNQCNVVRTPERPNDSLLTPMCCESGTDLNIKDAGSTPRPHLLRNDVMLTRSLLRPKPLAEKNIYVPHNSLTHKFHGAMKGAENEVSNKANESRFSALARKLRRTKSHATDLDTANKTRLKDKRHSLEKPDKPAPFKAEQSASNSKPLSKVARVKKALSFRKKRGTGSQVVKKATDDMMPNTAEVEEINRNQITQESLNTSKNAFKIMLHATVMKPSPKRRTSLTESSPLQAAESSSVQAAESSSVQAAESSVQSALPQFSQADMPFALTSPDKDQTSMADITNGSLHKFSDLSNSSLIECLKSFSVISTLKEHPVDAEEDCPLQTTIFDCTLDTSVDDQDVDKDMDEYGTPGVVPTGPLLRSRSKWAAQMDLSSMDQSDQQSGPSYSHSTQPDRSPSCTSPGGPALSLASSKKLFHMDCPSSGGQVSLNISNSSVVTVKRRSMCTIQSLDSSINIQSLDSSIKSPRQEKLQGEPKSSLEPELGGSMNNLTLISTPDHSHVSENTPRHRTTAKRPRHTSFRFGEQHAPHKRVKLDRVNSIKQAWKNTLRRTPSMLESTYGMHEGRGTLNRENAGHTPKISRKKKQPEFDDRLI